ncbi:MAG: nucleoside phosphorylase [Bacteroidetes bacterium]|nr:nucleoside phosphorylase [Bacteroidota bacterium]MBU1718027.1 nucleoside phosphorylase [Bacteroidota bacterium]
MEKLKNSELIINADGSIYHLKLRPEDIADTIIVVGDQHRVEIVSQFFDTVEVKKHNREFITHTGTYKKKKLTVLSTGIGTDNLDIVINELDAITNIDLDARIPKVDFKQLNIIRLGTSGALQHDIPVDSFLMSEYAIGFDGLLHYYADAPKVLNEDIAEAFMKHTGWKPRMPRPYVVKGSQELADRLGEGLFTGITATASGFYAPQGRSLRLAVNMPGLNDTMETFSWNGKRITNFEMETSALYGLCNMLGHNACTICTIIANRVSKQFSKDYHPAVEKMIRMTLDRLVK